MELNYEANYVASQMAVNYYEANWVANDWNQNEGEVDDQAMGEKLAQSYELWHWVCSSNVHWQIEFDIH